MLACSTIFKMSKSVFSQTRTIFGIGRNYAAHAKELNNPVTKNNKEMVIFLKPTTSLLLHSSGLPIVIPTGAEVHHEVELGVIIGKGGKNIHRRDALSHVAGYCLALDMTARNWQNDAKKGGLPWVRAKGPDTFCPVGEFIEASRIRGPVTLWLKVDGKERQRASTTDMIWPVEELIEECSSLFTLREGDLILSGTPEGVGPVLPGQTVTAGIEGICTYEWKAVAESRL